MQALAEAPTLDLWTIRDRRFCPWQGSLLLAHVGDGAGEGQVYLDRIARGATVPAETVLAQGKPGAALVSLAQEQSVTHVVMTSHGRTGLSRVIPGDVAAQPIDRPSVPIVVVPALAAMGQQSGQGVSDQPVPAPAVSGE